MTTPRLLDSPPEPLRDKHELPKRDKRVVFTFDERNTVTDGDDVLYYSSGIEDAELKQVIKRLAQLRADAAKRAQGD